jgi:hypothetical protein
MSLPLGGKQELFSILYADHIVWLYQQGYQVRMGDVFAHDGHRENSNHYLKLAGDLNLFRENEFLTRTSDHKFSGLKWEQRHPLCRWGGRFNDGNHYSLEHNGRK